MAAIWVAKISMMLHIRGIQIIQIICRRVLSRASICSVQSRLVAMKRQMLTRIGDLAGGQLMVSTRLFWPTASSKAHRGSALAAANAQRLWLLLSNGFRFMCHIKPSCVSNESFLADACFAFHLSTRFVLVRSPRNSMLPLSWISFDRHVSSMHEEEVALWLSYE